MLAAGPILYTAIYMYMRILCYLSHADISVQEQLWSVIRSKGWLSASSVSGSNFFFIPEDLVTWALIIDPSLIRCCDRDYIQ